MTYFEKKTKFSCQITSLSHQIRSARSVERENDCGHNLHDRTSIKTLILNNTTNRIVAYPYIIKRRANDLTEINGRGNFEKILKNLLDISNGYSCAKRKPALSSNKLPIQQCVLKNFFRGPSLSYTAARIVSIQINYR